MASDIGPVVAAAIVWAMVRVTSPLVLGARGSSTAVIWLPPPRFGLSIIT